MTNKLTSNNALIKRLNTQKNYSFLNLEKKRIDCIEN